MEPRLQDYFRTETESLQRHSLADIPSGDAWLKDAPRRRARLKFMLGLDPEPPRSPLRPVVTGVTEHAEFTVERLHFQSAPGLYVTANLYLPKKRSGPLPAILYVCGHGNVKENGYSYGSKAAYQHHGGWFARNGYACLILDTLQLAEIEGLHHGTYREKMWWWNSRGYSPAGVEAWNGVRAIDYLQSRPEVDGSRIGITGRSGGGAYSWWVAAIDERIKAAVPVAGITDLQNYVTDGAVEGHCDCMFMVNSERWDYDQVAALVAPRPLLISNSDKDPIFPLDGVYRIHQKIRKIYDLLAAGDKLGLLITEGPHKDTQELQVPTLRWFNRFLRDTEAPLNNFAEKFFAPEQLRVFRELPVDQRNTRIQNSFVGSADGEVSKSRTEWRSECKKWREQLGTAVFSGWPAAPPSTAPVEKVNLEKDGVRLRAYDFESQHHTPLRLFILSGKGAVQELGIRLTVLDEARWSPWAAGVAAGFGSAAVGSDIVSAPGDWAALRALLTRDGPLRAFIAPRGVGAGAYRVDEKKLTQIRRRFMLLGQTLDGMRVWDVVSALSALRIVREGRYARSTIELAGTGDGAVWALYATIMGSAPPASLVLDRLPGSHAEGPDFLNVLRVLDIPQATALAVETAPVQLSHADPRVVAYTRAVRDVAGWGERRLQVEASSAR